MSSQRPQKGAIGFAIDLTVDETIDDVTSVVDLSSTTQTNYLIRKPDGSIITRTATFLTDGTDGKLTYSTVAGDLDLSGRYEIQADLVFPAGYKGPTALAEFIVEDNVRRGRAS